MANVDRTVECFKAVHINGLDDDWAKDVWSRELVDFPEVETSVEVELETRRWLIEELQQILKILPPWIRGEHASDNTGFWTALVENDINYRSVVAILAYVIAKGQEVRADANMKRASIISLRVYTNLLIVPGSAAFRLFHPILFSRCVDGLKMWLTLGVDSVGKRKKQPPKRKAKLRGHGNKKTKETLLDDDVNDREAEHDGPDEEEEDDGADVHLMPSDIRSIQKHIAELFQDMLVLLQQHSLSASHENLDYLMDALVDLCKSRPETYTGDLNDDEDFIASTNSHIAHLSFKALTSLCNELHGDTAYTITQICKRLLWPVLMMGGDRSVVAMQTIPQSLVLVRVHCINFICFLLEKYKSKAYTSVRTLIQHVATRVPDKADYRNKAAEVICTLLKTLPNRHYASILEWIQKLSKSAKPQSRAFAIDVVSSLLYEKERPITVELSECESRTMRHVFLLEMILSRCSDTAPVVRSRAIGAFAACVSSPDAVVRASLQSMFTPVVARRAGQSIIQQLRMRADQQANAEATTTGPCPALGHMATPAAAPVNDVDDDTARRRTPVSAAANTTAVPSMGVDAGLTPTGVVVTPGTNLALSDCEGVVSMLRRRCVDDKVGVRKCAVQAVASIVALDGDWICQLNLEAIGNRCRDSALSVRKQALQSLSDLLQLLPDNELVQWRWMDSVLPLVMDRESSIQDKCLEAIDDILIANITAYIRSTSPRHHMAWSIINVLASAKGQELRFHLKQALQLLSQRKSLQSQLVTNLTTHVGTEDHDVGAWMMLAECPISGNKLPTGIVTDYWNYEAKHANDASRYPTLERVLTVLGHVAAQLPVEQTRSLIGDLQKRLVEFQSPPELIAVTVNTLFKLYQSVERNNDNGRKQMTAWCTELLNISDKYLSDVILNENQAAALMDEDRIVCHLFTIGHVGHLCPSATPKHVLMLVQSLIAAPGLVHHRSNSGISNTQHDNTSLSSCPGSEHSDSQNPSQPQPDSQMSLASTQVLTQFSGSKMTTKIRAHAFISLGKLCLQNESVAKKCVAAMVRELDQSEDAVIRNNVMIILCDLCVRYTTLTDRYIGQISNCIRDESPLVRKQTLTCIMSLLQEDYMKWRGTLIYKFLAAVVDENETISQFAEFCFVHLLLTRQPALFFQHFVETIFYFNSYEDHPVYNKFTMNEKEKKGFSLKGPDNKEKRMKIYKFMLENMSDAQRFNMMAKLSQDVLGGFTDLQMPLDAESQPVLNDTLAILISREMKVSTLRGGSRSGDDDNEAELDPATNALNLARKNLVTQVVKKNVMENIVPMIIALKHMLEAQRSPLLRDLMMFLRDLMKDYKNEIKDLLAADKQLASEIEFDLRRFDELTEREVAPPQPERPVLTYVPDVRPVRGTTPQTVRAPQVVQAPQLLNPVAMTTPARFKTPDARASAQRNQLVTPSRNKPLELANLVNSARKAMQSAGRSPNLKSASVRCGAQRQSPVARPALNDDDDEADDVIPRDVRRAISTPDRTIVDITFRGDVSMIAPSPISQPINRQLTGRTNRNAATAVRGKGVINRPLTVIQETTNLVLMKPPNQVATSPRHWNVTANRPVPVAQAPDDEAHHVIRDVIGHATDVVTDERENTNPINVRRGRSQKTASNKDTTVMNESNVRRSGRTRKT